ncbi:MAG TPA: TMEM175 family protein [Gaiellaceae bacterium]|nr:TMEM175 family protein [Gaiellaceae bacterium]
METERLETFSDGVFAIAATLLILEIQLPGAGSVTHELLRLWPSYLAYTISFLTIGIMWINHHSLFKQIDRVDRTFLAINVVFLMVIAFLPFPTSVLASHLHHDAKAATFFYGLTNVLMAVVFNAVWFYASIGRRLIRADADQRTISGITRAFRPGVPLYALATLSALVSSWLALALFAGLAIFYLLESSLLGRDG